MFFSSISGDQSHFCQLEIGWCELLYKYGDGLQRIDVFNIRQNAVDLDFPDLSTLFSSTFYCLLHMSLLLWDR